MGQIEGSKKNRRNKHLNWEERIQIETLQREGYSARLIGERIGRSERTIRRELKRGWVTHRISKYRVQERYSADRGQAVYDKRMQSKGRSPEINAKHSEYLHLHIVVHRQSPAVVAAGMKERGIEYAVCFKTIYNHIDKGLVPGVTNESLWEKRRRRKNYPSSPRKRKRAIEPGHCINDRPESIDDRSEAGHWEIDLVVAGKGKGTAVLLTLIERRSRKLIIRKLKDRTQRSVNQAINSIERQMGTEAFRLVFKSITADNGSEFLGYETLEQSVGGGKRTKIYYAHPYSSWERGSNENANRIIRRFIPKGADISKFTHKQIKEIENWINRYPRKILNFETAEEWFIRELVT